MRTHTEKGIVIQTGPQATVVGLMPKDSLRCPLCSLTKEYCVGNNGNNGAFKRSLRVSWEPDLKRGQRVTVHVTEPNQALAVAAFMGLVMCGALAGGLLGLAVVYMTMAAGVPVVAAGVAFGILVSGATMKRMDRFWNRHTTVRFNVIKEPAFEVKERFKVRKRPAPFILRPVTNACMYGAKST